MLAAYGTGNGQEGYDHDYAHDLDQNHDAECHHCEEQEPKALHRKADGLSVDGVEAQYEKLLVEQEDQDQDDHGES